mgnify:FL=1
MFWSDKKFAKTGKFLCKNLVLYCLLSYICIAFRSKKTGRPKALSEYTLYNIRNT